MRTFRSLFAIACLLVMTGTTGCSVLKPVDDPSRFYVLGDGTTGGGVIEGDCPRRILVGPVRLAGHLDRLNMARRVSANEIRYLDWDYWAEPLNRALPRELMLLMSEAADESCVFDYRAVTPDDDSIQLEIEVDQFEMTDRGAVVVVVRWTLIPFDDAIDRRRGVYRSEVDVPPGDNEVAESIFALRSGLRGLAERLLEEASVQ